jgi:hypothetical protein
MDAHDRTPSDSDQTKATHSIALEDNLATWMRQMAIWSSIGLAFFAFLYGTREELAEFKRIELIAMHSAPLLLLVIGIVTGVQAVDNYLRRAHTFDVPVTVSYVICSITWILILLGIICVALSNLIRLYRQRAVRVQMESGSS